MYVIVEEINKQPLRVGIIGAGVAGMAAAWELVKAGHRVRIFEAGAAVGGLAAGFKADGWQWWMEKFYHHWFTGDRDLLRLTDELGLRDKVIFHRPKTSYWINDKIVRSEMNASIFSLPLSPLDIVRMGAAGAFLKFAVRDGEFLEQYTAHEWMRFYMGRAAYEKFFQPLLIGKFGERYQEVNMAWMWARIFTRSTQLGTYQGGFQAFMEDFADALIAKGVLIDLNTPVDALDLDDDLHPTLIVDGQPHAFDRVISTTSPRLMLKLAPKLQSTHYSDQITELESLGAVVVIAALKHQLLEDNTYWLNLPATHAEKSQNPFPYLALVEHTNFIAPEHFNGDHLIYMGDYAPADHEYLHMEEGALTARFSASLGKFNPRFDPSWIKQTWVFRAPYAQPLPLAYQREKIPDLKTPLPGVFWASMSQVYPYDRGTNFAVEIGRRVAQQAIDDVASP
jgi:protoporphyrinogen oxidase